MNEIKAHDIQISEKFLQSMTELTKTALRVYLSLAYYKAKEGNNFHASHRDICINYFYKNRFGNGEWFGVATDHSAFLKAIKQLEEMKLIKVYRTKTVSGKPLTNRYRVY